MKPKFFIITFALAVAWAFLGANQALAQTPFPTQVLSVKLSKTVSAVVDPDGVEVRIWCDFNLNPWSTLGTHRSRDAWVSMVRCVQAEALAKGLRPRGMAKREFAEATFYLLRGANMAVAPLNLETAECKAVQQVEFLAEEFGVGREYARDLANLAWKQMFKGDGCRPGGPLDFHLGRWPSLAYLPPEDIAKG